MRRVYADAGYWIALHNPEEALHERAIAAFRRIGGMQIATSELVLAEYLNAMSDRGRRFRTRAAEWVRELRFAPDVTIVRLSPLMFENALNLYASRPDKDWGFIDCSSFAIMSEMSIAEAMTHDHHFEQAGFTALLR